MADETQNPDKKGTSEDVNLGNILNGTNDNNFEPSIEQKVKQEQDAAKAKELAAAELEAAKSKDLSFNGKSEEDIKKEKEAKEKEASNNGTEEIHADDLVIDLEGNLINEKTKKILIPKDKVKFDKDNNVILPENFSHEGGEEDTGDDSSASVKALQETINVFPVDDKGKKKKYDDSALGLIQYVKDVKEEVEKGTIEKYLKANPILNAFVNHIENGGRESDFSKKVQFSTITYDDKNEKLNLDLYAANLQRKGVSKEDIDDMLSLAKTNGTWLNKGKASYEELVNNETAARTEDEKLNKSRQEKEAKAIEKYWNEVEQTIVKKGTIEDIVIPTDDREKFFNYLARPVDEYGNSQYVLDFEALPQEKRILLQYLAFKGGDLTTIIQEKSRTLAVKRLADKKTPKSINVRRLDINRTSQDIPTIGDITGKK